MFPYPPLKTNSDDPAPDIFTALVKTRHLVVQDVIRKAKYFGTCLCVSDAQGNIRYLSVEEAEAILNKSYPDS